jgi:diacylglycerol O-acyltransferase / wax synthase
MSAKARLNGLDAIMLWAERGSFYSHTLKIMILDPSTDPDGWSFERYRALVQRQIAETPMFRWRYLPTPFGVNKPVWVEDPEFELDVHMHRVVCPAPGGLAEFCTLVEQIYCHPLDHNRPLWQVWAVEGLKDGRVAILILLHHAYSDGAGVRAIVEDLLETEPSGPPLVEPMEQTAERLPTAWKRLWWGVRDLGPLIREVPGALRAVAERGRRERDFAAGGGYGGPGMPSAADRRQEQPFGGCVGRSRRFACRSFSLEAMQEVRAALGGTINDIFLSCAAGSVRELLLKRGLPCESPTVASMAMVTRPVAERSMVGGNYSSGDDVWLHVELEDAVERLAATRASAQVTKDHFQALAGADRPVLMDLIPDWLLKGVVRLDERTAGRYTPGRNIVVSNARGPAELRYMGRWRMEQWFSTGQILHGARLNLTCWTYADQFNLCALAGSPLVSDAWELIDGFDDALDELRSAARANAPTQVT